MMRRWMTLVVFTVVVAVGGAGASPAAAEGLFPASVASGDPRPDSVILWTRAVEPAMPDALLVEVATDMEFADVVFSQDLTASADNGWCVKVRATGLQPYTTYYYRFVCGSGAAMEISPVGRTKTAPTPEMDVPVKYAVVYGQDYIGHYFNTYAKLLNDHDEDIDFVVHLGDYVYETTGDPSFQNPDSERKVEFSDTQGAIRLGSQDDPSTLDGLFTTTVFTIEDGVLRPGP